MKTCTLCGVLKSLDEFFKCPTGRDGLTAVCKPCHMRRSAESRRQNVAGSLLCGARSNAKRRGIAFSLTRDDIVVPSVCPVLGIPLKKARWRMDDNSPSIDRLDSSKGYEPGNIHIISWKANRLKSNATKADIIALAEWLKLQS